uniref:Putative reverse transcriptase maturase n=1 Tax=Monomorphina aenigmatica TaxID=304863 RepID=L0BGF7_MONAE|nr:putative reverse transcriptase maturase [Monomorphina aenigmatica]AFZ88772.1 putative reverse transcriptase maturase [Monomorphina aenigmatica]
MKNSHNTTYFLKKKSNNKNFILTSPYKHFLSNISSVHDSMNSILQWDCNINFLIKFQLSRFFNNVCKNRLKNIFLNKIKDFSFWIEIEKMLEANCISLSSDKIYRSDNCLNFSIFSRFLLNLYLSELDFFLKNIILRHNSKINLLCVSYEENSRNLSFNDCIPLKLEKGLVSLKRLRLYTALRYNILKEFFIAKRNNISKFFKFRYFRKLVYYNRFLDHFLVGLEGSLNFAKFISENVLGFVRTTLNFDINSSDLVFDFYKSFNFLGFDIKIKKFKKESNLLPIANFDIKISERISSYKQRLAKLLVSRSKFELLSFVSRILNFKDLKNLNLKDKFFWSYVFQLECTRSTQLSKLINTKEMTDLISNDLFSSIKSRNLNVLNYRVYSFNIFIKKLQVLLNNVVLDFTTSIDSSISSLDFTITDSLEEFRTNIGIFNNNLKFSNRSLFLNDNKKRYNRFLFSNLRTKDLFYFNNVYNHKSDSCFNIYKFKCLKIYFPLRFALTKLRILGFLHPLKKRVVGNCKYIFMEDLTIIKSFGFLAANFLTWFRCCQNIDKVKALINIIRQSCFLTLCRKHNKSKTWVYSVYTSELVVLRKFSFKNNFFPSKEEILKIKPKFLKANMSFLDEAFFLIN